VVPDVTEKLAAISGFTVKVVASYYYQSTWLHIPGSENLKMTGQWTE
jgi:hypothetical protein